MARRLKHFKFLVYKESRLYDTSSLVLWDEPPAGEFTGLRPMTFVDTEARPAQPEDFDRVHRTMRFGQFTGRSFDYALPQSFAKITTGPA